MVISESASFLLNTIGKVPLYFYKKTLAEVYTSNKEEENVYILLNYIEAHEKAQHKLSELTAGLSKDRDRDRDLLAVQEAVMKDSKENVVEARSILALADPVVQRSIATKQTVRFLLAKQTLYVKAMVHEGLIASKEADSLYEAIRSDTTVADRQIFVRYDITI